MKKLSKTSQFLIFGALLSLGACQITVTDDDNDGGDASTADSATTDSGTTADADSGTDADASTAVTYIRLAAFSPDSDAVDYCLAPHGTTDYVGPILYGIGPQLSVDGSKGLQFGETSIYVSTTPGYYDVRIVPAGAISCATNVIATDSSIGYFAQDAYQTLVLAGDATTAGSDPSIDVIRLTDSLSVTGYAKFRFVHVSPGLPSLDLGFGSLDDSDFKALFSSVAYGATGMSSSYGTVDANGYLTTSAWSDQTLSLHTSVGATSDSLTAEYVDLEAGSLASFWAIGGKTGDTQHPLSLVRCLDNGTVSGYLAPCQVISE